MEILVNHLTRMNGGHVCVAGLDRDGRHVRPVLQGSRLGGEALEVRGGPFALGRIVDIGEAVPRPCPPEVEDRVFSLTGTRAVHRVDGEWFWEILDALAFDELTAVFGSALVRDGGTASLPAGEGTASLGILQPRSRPILSHTFGKLRLGIVDPELGALSLPITDVRLYDLDRNVVDDRRATLLEDRLRRRRPLLSVGIGRPWARNGGEPRHWLQVNNVHLDDNPLWPN
jgi:hypothetical protein